MGSVLVRIKKMKLFLGNEVLWLLLRAIIIGLLWFCVESSFLVVLQGLLRSLGLVTQDLGGISRYLPESILGSSMMLVLYGLFRSLIHVMREYYVGATGQAFVRLQREKITKAALKSTDSVTSYDVMSLFTDTVNRSENVVLQLTQFVNLFTSSLLLFLLGLKLAPIELILGIGLLGVFVWPINRLTRAISQTSTDLAAEWNNMNRLIHLGFKNGFFLKVNHWVDREIMEVRGSLSRFERIYRRLYLNSGLKGGAPIFMGILVLSVIMFVSVSYIHTPGTVLVSFFYIFIRISQAASEGNVAISNLKINFPSLRKLYHWTELHGSTDARETREEEPAAIAAFQRVPMTLQMEGVNYSHPGKPALFRNMGLQLHSGDLFLVKGESGSGKSTFLSLILGVAEPEQGTIRLNGQPLRAAPRALARLIGYVGAEPYLIPGTVRQNLTYGSDGARSDQEMLAALKDACVFDEIMALPGGLDEILNEATQLSTGQKQRLAIARAYLKNPKVLVWDEATANLDETLERRCIENLLTNLKDRITLVVSHKNSFDAHATKILNLDRGYVS
jgi:ABC-type multidrug transport system fused ATPase/permease subunit